MQVIGVHNPGTPESALIDMRLLSECNELVVTVGSSYGSISAGIGGIPPVQMLHGLHKNVQVQLHVNIMHLVARLQIPVPNPECLHNSDQLLPTCMHDVLPHG